MRPANYKVNSSIFDKIKNLKANGVNYDKGSFIQLLNAINSKNIIKFSNLNKSVYDEKQKFSLMIEMLRQDTDDEFQVLLQNVDNEINGKNKKGVTNELSSYLMRTNEITKNDIVKTVKINSSTNETNFVKEFLDSIMDKLELASINITLTKLQDILRKITNVYPNIILKSLDSKVTMDSLPKHWKLSERQTLIL